MAREYKIHLERPGFSGNSYVHDDNTYEIVDPDSGQSLDYLQDKLRHTKDIVAYMRSFGIAQIKVDKV